MKTTGKHRDEAERRAVSRTDGAGKQTGPSRVRCPWCLGDQVYMDYHDREWGRPVKDGRKLFEFLVLEGAQAGLSWITILRRREGYRAAFDGFDPEKMARYGERDIARLLKDERIIRNRLKIISAISNARAFLRFEAGPIPFSRWLWSQTGGKPVVNRFKTPAELPAATPLAERISKDLKKSGFTFVGPVIVYSLLQATGLVNDHLTDCFCHPDNRKKA
ncbi:MAG: DNA-3-methyladenine glycosylase I [Spirochaetaceae bacterium]|nr:DNA-3-methyladenine glycosylase I [Spirochaetaceae bacterium]